MSDVVAVLEQRVAELEQQRGEFVKAANARLAELEQEKQRVVLEANAGAANLTGRIEEVRRLIGELGATGTTPPERA